jgi:hypothetical protein
MMNNQNLKTGDNWRQLAAAVCFKVRYFRQFASSASPYKGRQTGVEETDPRVLIRGQGMWCLTHASATIKHSALLAGTDAGLDSLKAAARSPTAWPRSDESTGFLGPAIATIDLADTVQTRRQACGTNAGKTATSRFRPHDGRSRDERPSVRRACGERKRRATPIDAARRASPHPGRGKNGSLDVPLQPPTRIICARDPGSRTGNFPGNILEKPSAVTNPLEINWLRR